MTSKMPEVEYTMTEYIAKNYESRNSIGARRHTTMRRWSTGQGGTVSEVILLLVQSYCLIQEVAWVNTKDQIISPFSNRMFWTGTALQHKNHSGMFLFTDAEVCVTAFVTEAHWFACVQGKTPFISSIQIFLPSVCHNGFFIMHEGAHNPD